MRDLTVAQRCFLCEQGETRRISVAFGSRRSMTIWICSRCSVLRALEKLQDTLPPAGEAPRR